MDENNRYDEGPEAEGIPDYADDTSAAYDEQDRPRSNDSPAALPADTPQAIDDYGVTAAESSRREPLEQRLEREEPDVTATPDPMAERVVGRIVAPGEGTYADNEEDEVAFDLGSAGGGPTAEESAIHEVDDDWS